MGIFCWSIRYVTLRNYNQSSTYPATFTVANTGIWQYTTLTIPPPPAGTTWSNVEVYFCARIANVTNIANAWNNTNQLGCTTSVNLWGTTGNYIEITGLQFEKGTIATPFEFRPFALELQLCQRYYEKSYPYTVVPGTDVNTSNTFTVFPLTLENNILRTQLISYRVLKRTSNNTISIWGATGAPNIVNCFSPSSTGVFNITTPSVEVNVDSGFSLQDTSSNNLAGYQGGRMRVQWSCLSEL